VQFNVDDDCLRQWKITEKISAPRRIGLVFKELKSGDRIDQVPSKQREAAEDEGRRGRSISFATGSGKRYDLMDP
jgi:hypothetical protein